MAKKTKNNEIKKVKMVSLELDFEEIKKNIESPDCFLIEINDMVNQNLLEDEKQMLVDELSKVAQIINISVLRQITSEIEKAKKEKS